MTRLKIINKLLILIALLLVFESSATHIDGGYITYERIDNLTVSFTFVGYRNPRGVLFGQGRFDFGDGNIHGDEDGEAIPWDSIIQIAEGVEQWKFTLIHTYASPGTMTVSYTEDFRTADVQNMSSSVESAFYVESMLVLDPLSEEAIVATPRTLPLSDAIAGSRVFYSLGLENIDNDSLRIVIVEPQQATNTPVPDYRFPNATEFYTSDSESKFEVDQLNGALVWDAPTVTGLYSLSLKVEEWKKVGEESKLVGYVIYDYLVEVKSSDEVVTSEVPNFSCYSIGDRINESMIIDNPGEKDLSVNLFSDLPLLFDGLTVDEWNQSDFTSSSSTIEIVVEGTFDQSILNLATINFVTVEISGSWVFDEFFSSDHAITKSFGIGFNCDVETVELITEVSSPLDDLNLTVLRDHIVIQSAVPSKGLEAFLYDLKGNLLEHSRVNFDNKLTLEYTATSNQVYVLKIQNGEESYVNKFLFP